MRLPPSADKIGRHIIRKLPSTRRIYGFEGIDCVEQRVRDRGAVEFEGFEKCRRVTAQLSVVIAEQRQVIEGRVAAC